MCPPKGHMIESSTLESVRAALRTTRNQRFIVQFSPYTFDTACIRSKTRTAQNLVLGVIFFCFLSFESPSQGWTVPQLAANSFFLGIDRLVFIPFLPSQGPGEEAAAIPGSWFLFWMSLVESIFHVDATFLPYARSSITWRWPIRWRKWSRRFPRPSVVLFRVVSWNFNYRFYPMLGV